MDRGDSNGLDILGQFEQQFERDPVTKKFICAVCGVVFNHKYSLIRHSRLHTGERPYKCNLCECSFRALDKLRTHEKSKHPTLFLKFECDECHEEFPSFALLKAHKKQHVGIHECDICGVVWTKKGQLTAHKKLKHSDYKPFKCHVCCKGFPLKYCLRRHMKSHGEEYVLESQFVKEKNFSCDICGAAFVEKQTLDKHIQKHIERPYECEICHAPCATKHGLSLHKTAKHLSSADTRYECDICGKNYAWKHAVTWHKKEVHGIKRVQTCVICGMQFLEVSDLQEHRKMHSGKKCYECKVCDKMFYKKAALDIHKRLHTGEKPFVCEICGKAFRSSACLRIHCMRGSCSYQTFAEDTPAGIGANSGVLSVEENQKECPICHVRFRNAYLLRTHLTAHPSGKLYEVSSEKPSTCGVCGRSFATEGHKRMHRCKSSFKQPNEVDDVSTAGSGVTRKPHIVTIHTGKAVNGHDEKTFVIAQDVGVHSPSEEVVEDTDCHPCEICDDVFPTSSELETHQLSHVVKKEYECKVCGKCFSSKSSLYTHCRIHANKKPYECDICGKHFAHSSTRSNHKKLHSGEKPYVCEICGKNFVVKSALDVHRRIHTGERPYCCDVCGRTFSQMSTRNSHRKMHTGLRPFQCDKCDKKYAERRALNAHMKIHARS